MSDTYGPVAVFSEDRDTLHELLTCGREMADALQVELVAILLGDAQDPDAGALGAYSADKVYVATDPALAGYNVETYTDALAGLCAQITPEVLLVGATQPGLELAPRVAQRLRAGCVPNFAGFSVDAGSGQLHLDGGIFSGRGLATYAGVRKPILTTVVPRQFEVQAVGDGQAEVVPAQVEINAPRLQVVETRPKDVYDRGLEQAEVIVDAGQGIQAKEDLQMLEELAELLGGQVTCTRPLSSELEWMPDFLGLSGKHVSPRLCITVGVSGAIQHMVGIRDSKVIVAINNDPNAGIHMQADYSIVGDLYEVVPALTEALKNR